MPAKPKTLSVSKRRARAKKRAYRPTIGYVLFENPNIVVIATTRTKNPKTGDMVQIWILPRDVDPMRAVQTGEDDIVCFDCKHRGDKSAGRKRTCYVQVAKAPRGIWRAYNRGRYEYLAADGYQSVFGGKKIRFGAYGEPVLIPIAIVRALSAVSAGRTGYTHQWMRAEYQVYRPYVMASVDSPAEYALAKSFGWRTFRARTADQALSAAEIICPASDEAGYRTTCAQCRLCDGARENDARKDIAIIVHGAAAKSFVSVDALIASVPSAEVKLEGAVRDAYIARRFGADALVSIGGMR